MRKSKISMIIATVLTLSYCRELSSLKEILLIWIAVFATCKMLWRMFQYTWYALKGEVLGGFQSGSCDREKAIADSIYSRMYGGGRTYDAGAARRAADRRVWEHTKAQNEAAFQAYQAKKAASYNPNSYETYQKQNRARDARNKANRPY